MVILFYLLELFLLPYTFLSLFFHLPFPVNRNFCCSKNGLFDGGDKSSLVKENYVRMKMEQLLKFEEKLDKLGVIFSVVF